MTVRLVAIGFGGVARPQLQYFDLLDDVEIVAGADVAADAREWFEASFEAPAYERHGELLAEHGTAADAATVITPHSLHRAQILDCFEAGLDVYVEKPMVVGLDAAVEVVDTARDLGRVLQVGYQRHFHPVYEELRALIDDGRIGEPRLVSCYLEQDWLDPQAGTWRTDPDVSGGGQLYDSGSHLLDALLWTTGAEPRRVAAVMIDDPQRPGVDVDSALAVTLDRDGRPVTASVGVTADGVAYPETGEGFVVVGSAGTIEYDEDALVVTEQGTDREEQVVDRLGFDVDPEAVFVAKLDDFLAAVRGEREPAVPGEAALPVTALTEAAYEARDRDRTVDVQAALERARTSVADE